MLRRIRHKNRYTGKKRLSGGIMGAVPGKFGIGIFGPVLDEKGNSVAGLKLLELLTKNYRLSMF